MAKLADALDSGSSGAIHGGSIPLERTFSKSAPVRDANNRPYRAFHLAKHSDQPIGVQHYLVAVRNAPLPAKR